jgi:hypothetical protein
VTAPRAKRRQSTATCGADQQVCAGRAGQAEQAAHKAFLARLVVEGLIPANHGVVRWRACDLIMRLHEEFSLSVSDDTAYRALKQLGFRI